MILKMVSHHKSPVNKTKRKNEHGRPPPPPPPSAARALLNHMSALVYNPARGEWRRMTYEEIVVQGRVISGQEHVGTTMSQ